MCISFHIEVAYLAHMFRLHLACIPCLLNHHDRGWAYGLFVLAFHLISKLLTWLSGHHALKCVIDGPGVEGHAPLSPLYDRECVPAYICLEILCLALLVCCCCQNCLLQEFCADRQYRVPTGNVFSADSFISSRWTLYTAGGHSIQPMMILRMQGAYSGTFTVFQRSRTVKAEPTVLWQRVSRRSQSEHACIPLPEAFYCFQ